MKQRWLVAVVGLPLLILVLIACPSWATMLLIAAISGVAAYELLHVAGKKAAGSVYGMTVACALLQVWIVYDHRRYLDTELAHHFGEASAAELWQLPALLLIALFFVAVVTYGKPNAMPFSDVATAFVGGAVLPMMYACILLLRMRDECGRLYVLAPFVIAFAGDSLALYFGKWFGKTKMAPLVSPKKTWAGFRGSILGSVLGTVLLGLIGARWLGYRANYLALALVGVAANLLGQLGDLSMSLVKREAGVKDFSNLLLTHGGVLDRFDSVLFIAPAVYFFVNMGII